MKRLSHHHLQHRYWPTMLLVGLLLLLPFIQADHQKQHQLQPTDLQCHLYHANTDIDHLDHELHVKDSCHRTDITLSLYQSLYRSNQFNIDHIRAPPISALFEKIHS